MKERHRVGSIDGPSRGMRKLSHFTLWLFLFGQQQIVMAGTNIIPTNGNGWTTSADPHATLPNTTEITGARQIGGNAYNSFQHFGVAADQTVNFRLDGAVNLVNLVRMSRTDINGVLNSYKNGVIGGNVFFVNPHGITVGAGGIVNVGSLSMVVPTQSAMNDYISALEDSSSTVDERLLFIGGMQLAEDGEIDVQGTINAQDGVLLLANSVNVSGSVNVGEKYTGRTSSGEIYSSGAELFSALVKVSADFQDELGIFEVDGEIVIGAAGLSGGIINDLNPAKNTSASITVTDGASIQTEGGTVQIAAAAKQNPASIDNGLVEWNTTSATVDIDGATITSDSGEVVIDAATTVDLEVGGFDGLPIAAAIAKSDAESRVRVSGASEISAATDVTISSSSDTDISATANAESSIGTLTIAVANVDSDSSTVVDGTATINAGGAVSIDSISDTGVKVMADGLLSDGSGGGLAIAITDVDSSSTAAISGNAQIQSSASVAVTSSVANSIDTAARSVVTGDPQSISEAVNAQANLDDNPSGEADGLKTNIDTALNDSFEVEDDGQASSPQLAAAFAYTAVDSSSVATIDAGIDDLDAEINSSGDINVVAKSMTDAFNLAQGKTAVGADASISAGVSILHSKEVIRATVAPAVGKLAVTGNSLNVAALNEDYSSPGNSVGEMTSIAYAGSGGGGELGIAGAFAINLQDRDSVASVNGDGTLSIDVNGDLDVTASSSVSDAVVASATLTGQEAQDAEDKFAANSAAQQDPEPSAAVPEAGSTAGVGAAMAINAVTNTTDARLGSGVTFLQASNLSVDANSKADASISSKAGVAAAAEGGSQAAVGVGASVAVSVVADNTHAEIETNVADLMSAGIVSVSASHTGAINVTSDGSAAGDSAAIGASIAISVSDANTQALLSRDVSAASVDLAASSNTSNTTVAKASASGAEQEDPPAEEPAPGEKTGVDKQAADLTTFAGDKKEGGSTGDPESESAETPGGTVAVAAGLAVTVTEATVRAENTGAITTTGNTSITSESAADSKAEADGSAVNGSNSVGIGAAVAVNTLTQSNTSTARNISSDVGLTVGATQIGAEENDSGAIATSGAGAANVGVAGSVAVNVVNNQSTATYANGVVRGGAVDIDASNRSASITKAGATIEGEGDSVGVGAGVAVDVVVTETLAVIMADADVAGSSSVAVDADSSFTADLKSEAGQQGESSGGSVGVTGTVAVGVYSNSTRARIAAASNSLVSAGEVHVGASHTNNIGIETGADAAGDKAAIGASIAIAVSNADTEALISRDVTADGVNIVASSSTSNSTLARASASGAAAEEEAASGGTAPAEEESSVNKDVDTWQTFATDKDDSGSTASTDTEGPDASSSEGQVSVAAAVAVTVTDVDTVAKVDDGVTITAVNNVAVMSSANTDAQAAADGSAANGGVGVGVGVAINVANNNNTAFIGQGADVQGGNIAVSAAMAEDDVEGQNDPDTVNSFAADATSGAGAAKVGVAGSLALNVVTNESRAYIAGSENLGTAAEIYTEGDLSLTAANNASHVTKAQASVSGDAGDSAKGVGIGASVAINTFTNRANAEIRDDVIIAGDRNVASSEAGSLTMASSSQYNSETKAEAGAEGEEGADPSNDIAVDAAVALVVANNETTTSIGDTDTSAGFSGDIDLDASSDQSNTTEANGDSAGSSVAIGAVAAANIGISSTAIAVKSDLKTSAGKITMDAASTSADKALARASARGASKKKAQDKYDATEEEVDSGDFGNGADDNKATSATVLSDNSSAMEQPDTGDSAVDDQSGDKGKWNVSVAAAVGANIVDNDTTVIVAADKTLAAGGSIDINASSDSNYMTLGSGEAVAVSDGTSGSESGGGIGIGVGVAVTVARNDTVAEVSSIESAGDVSITADSTQNMNEDFIKELTSEAIAGASADKVAVAGAVAAVVTSNNTRAEFVDNAVIGDIAALNVTSSDQSKISSRAVAWVDPDKGTTAGVGASAAILLSKNINTARIGDGVTIKSADSINVAATNHRVTPETVGLDFDEIINKEDVLDSALLAGRTAASDDDSENTGTEPEVDPETGGPALIFDKLESTATDARHALEDYIRSHNYYTEAAAGSASTSGEAKYGVAGSFAVTVLQNQTEASIGNVTINNVAGKVDVTADTDADIAGFTGSVVKAGSVGVGVSATTLVNVDTTRALVGNDSAGAAGFVSLGTADPAFNIGDLNVSASSDQDILGIGVSAAAASSSSEEGGSTGVAVSGVLNTTVLVNDAEARIANDADIYSTGSVDVDAEGVTDIVSVVGGIALGGKVGVGASVGTNVISGQTHAAIGDRATVVATDAVAVAATAEEDIISIVVGAGASKKVGVAGSLATNVIAASTTATIGTDALVTQTAARDAESALNAISVQAADTTSLFSLAGGGAIGGKAGVGAAADVAVFSKNTVASTEAGSVLTAGGNVDVTAKSKDDIVSLTGAGAASSSGAAVAGVASVKVVVDTTHALINSDSVEAGGNVDVLAQSDTDLNIYDGTIAISGGSAGVGGAVAVNTIVKDSAAKVGAGVEITARGDLENSQVYNGELDRSGYVSLGSIARPDSDDEPAIGVNAGELTDAQKQTSAHRGLSVTAFATEDIETIGVSASASRSVAVAGNLSVDVISNTTEAAIGTGATVNAVGVDASDSSSSVLVQSYDYTDLNAMLGSGALGVSSAGVGAAGDVSVISKTTTAHIDSNADIDTEQDVAILAGSEEDVDSLAAAVGVGSTAGVSGSAGVLVINSETRAYTASNLDVDVGANTINIDAGRDFIVEAEDRTDLFVFNTALAAGSTAGVGGSAGVVVLTNETEARVGRGTVSNADRRTVVRADSDEKLTGIAMGAAGGGTAGVSGQLGVHVLASDTAAIIEDDVTINKESWNDAGDENEQSVAVIASNDVELLSISGTIALGGTAGVGGALTADVVKNHVRASVGNSEVYAGSAGNGDVDLGNGLFVEDGLSIRASSEKDITAVSVAGSGGGTAGVAGAASILIVGSDNNEDDSSGDSFGGDMDTYTSTGEGGEESSQLAVADSGSESRTGDTLGAQGEVEVSEGVTVAQYVDDNSQSSGSGYFSLDSASGTSGDTVAVVASGAKIQTKGDLEISANDNTTLNVVGGSIAIGGTAGVGGAGALVLLNQGTRAIVQDDAIDAVELDATRTMNVNAKADSQIFDVTATVAAGATAGVSGSLLLNVVDSRVEASIGDGALVNQDATLLADEDQSVIVDANNSSTLIATTANGSGSGTAAVGGVAMVNVLSAKTRASIGEAAQVNAQRDVKVIADGSEQVIANGASAAISGVAGVGGVINVTTINTDTEARIEAGAIVDSDGNVLIAAEDDTSLIANSWGVAIGLGGAGVGGSFGVNTIVKNTSAVIVEGATVNARGNNANTIDVYTGKLVSDSSGDNLLDNIIEEIEDESGDESQDGKWKRIVGLSGAENTEATAPASSTSLGNTNKVSEQVTGLAVVASSTEDVLSSNASAAGGLYAGVSGSGQVLSVITDTNATVNKGVTIDASDVRLSAADHTDSFSLSGGLALSGVAGVGGAVANGNIIKHTSATLGSGATAGEGVNVTASGDVIVDAESSEDIDEILVNVAGAGIAGVGGGIGVHVVVSETNAEVGNNAVIDAASDLRVRSNSNTEIDAFNGNLTIGGVAGVGAAVGTNVIANNTTARIGDNATTDADDATEVSADSVSDVETITIAASGGAVGVAGGIQVNVVNTTAAASIGQDARVNTAGTGNAGQLVSVTAVDDSTINSTTAAAAVGAAAIGGVVSVDILRNSASATIGSGAEVNANDSINIAATTLKTLDADSVSAAAGGFGMSGSIAVAAVGGDLNDDAYSEINGEDENGNENADSGSINKAGSSSGVNPLASDDEDSQLNDFNATSTVADDVDQRNAEREAEYGVSDDVASTADPRSGTLAAVGFGAKLKAGGNLNVTAQDTTTTNMLTGAVGVGSVAGAGAAAITVVGNNTEAMIGSNATLDSGADLSISAINNKTLDAIAASGAVSFANSVAGSIGVTVDSSTAKAHVDSGAMINQDSITRALVSQQNVTVKAVNNAHIDVTTGAVSASIGSGIGGTLNVVTTSQVTEALINVGPTGRVSSEGLINVDADSISTSNAQSAVGAGGLAAGIAGGLVTLFDDSTTSASIGNGSVIDDADQVKVDADSSRTTKADTKGAAVGAVGVGGSVATVEMDGVTTASVAANAKLGSNGAIGSLDVDATATETATATAVALAAGIISGAGGVATSSINSTVSASTGRNTDIIADGAVSVTAQATPKALSRTTAGSFGAATVGASVAEVDVAPTVTAIIDGSDIEAGSLIVSAKVLEPTVGRTADAYAEAASGGLLLGANATVSDTSVKGSTISTLGAGTILNINGNTTVTSKHDSDQYAETKSFAAGLAALGGAFSSGTANTISQVNIADGANITGGDLTLNASGDDRNQVKAKSGSGGAVAGAAAVAETVNISLTTVSVGDGNIVAGNVDIDATHIARFDHETDSSSGGLLGASGAVADNLVDARVAVHLAGSIAAESLDARSRNQVEKRLVGGFNVNAGAGGLLGGAAADSETVISRMTSELSVADTASLIVNQEGFSSFDDNGNLLVDRDGDLTLEASNILIADDRAKLDSGGAIAIALAETSIATNGAGMLATVDVGKAAVVKADGDITMAAYSDADVNAAANASTYGLAGAAQGESTSTVRMTNTVKVQAAAETTSGGRTRLMAGRTASGQSVTQDVLANTDLWNKTAFPVETDPEADAFLSNSNVVDVAGSDVANPEATVRAGGDIYLIADEGSANVKGAGTGKDLYRQAAEDVVNFFGDIVGADDVSFDITGGSSTSNSTETVSVNGLVNAGIDNKLKFRIIRNKINNDLEFYEGDFVDGMTPTLIVRDTVNGLVGIDSAGNEFAIVIDAEGNYLVAASDDGLSTSVKLELDFNPLQVMLDRLNEVNNELDDIFLKSGGLTATQVAERDALYQTGQLDAADFQRAEDLLDNVFTRDSGNNVLVFAGVRQLRGSVANADTAVGNGEAIATPLTLWQDQKLALEAEAQAWTNGDNDGLGASTTQKAAIILDLQNQASEIQNNLIVRGQAINADLALIVILEAAQAADPQNVDNSVPIAAANARITTQRNLLTGYDSVTLASRESTLVAEYTSKLASSNQAFVERDAITPNISNIEGTLQPYVNRLKQEKNWIQGRIDEYGGADASGTPAISYELIDFTDKMFATSADIFVESDKLNGNGALIANRDTEISILNKTPAYLRISGGAEIPFDAGGSVYVNDAPIRDASLGGLAIGDGSDAFTKIKFLNDYAPLGTGGTSLQPPQGPDLIISENLSNFNGLIHLESLFGGVTTDAGVRVDADTIVISAGRDVVLSYAGGIRHIAGDVKCEFSSASDCTPASGVVPGVIAGNNVYVAGEYLNINGKIQSGIPKRTITIDGTANGQWENGGLVEKKVDNKGQTYFEVKPLYIAGGYVDLYGHIISTPVDKSSNAAAGEIQVMDGYGEIEVINNTDLNVRVTGMSAGTGVQARVRITDLDFDLNQQGHDKVTEYTYYRDNTADQRVEVSTSYLGSTSNLWKTDDESNDLVYNPLTGQQYSWENIRKDGWTQRRYVERETYFVFFGGDDVEVTRTPQAVQTQIDQAPIKDDLVVKARTAGASTVAGTGGAYAIEENTTSTTSNGWSMVEDSYDSDEYLVYRYEDWTEQRSGTDFVYVKNFVTADKHIDISFVGNSTGTVTLTGTGKGNIEIAGSILNPTGLTSIDSGAGDILQTNDTAVLWTRDLSLSGRSIGAAIPSTKPAATGASASTSTSTNTGGTVYVPIEINLVDGGRLLDANVAVGDLVIEQLDGDLLVGDLTAANGDVWLKATGSILNDENVYPGKDNDVTGKRVTLVAQGGTVGTSDNAIRVNTEATADGGLSVEAATDINVTENEGDLYLISATSSTGDVTINVAAGNLVDNNVVETRDERTIAELLGLWDEMEFLTETTGDVIVEGDIKYGVNSNDSGEGITRNQLHDVAQDNLEARNALKKTEYERYWDLRNQNYADGEAVTDTAVVLSTAEREQFAEQYAAQLSRQETRDLIQQTGDTSASVVVDVTDARVIAAVDEFEMERSAEFARLHEEFGSEGTSYNLAWAYSMSTEEANKLTEHAGWTELELLARFGPGMLKDISDTKLRIEEANAAGKDIKLTVSGDIGTYQTGVDGIVIDLLDPGFKDYTSLSEPQKLALLTAERRDIEFIEVKDVDNVTTRKEIVIATYEDVDVEATGTLSVSAPAAERIYLGSESDLDIGGIVGLGDVRIRTEGHLTGSAADGFADVVGKDIILESSGQSIGAADDFFRISSLSDGSLTARAGGSIWLDAMNDGMAIDTVFARNLFNLKAIGDVVEYEPDAGADIRAASLVLDIGGAFGANGLNESLDITLNPNGILVGDIAEGAFITSPDQNLRLGNFEVGGTSVFSSKQDIYLYSEQQELTRTILNSEAEEEEFVYLATEEKGLVSRVGSMTLIANGSILDEDGGARAIEALELDLVSGNGDIGATDNTLDIDVVGPQGVLAQAENGSVYIESPDSDLRLRNVTTGDTSMLTSDGDILLVQSANLRSTGGTLALEANGSILDESGDSMIEAVDLSLQANKGAIGSAQRSLHVNTETISSLSAPMGVYLTETSGDMNIGKLYNGSGEVVLHVAESDAWLNISGGMVDGRMLWNADNMLVENLVHGGKEEELYFEVTSSSGGMADDISISYRSDRKVRFTNLEAKRARILGDVNDLRFDRVLTGETGLFTNDTTSVFVDNTNSGLHKQYTIQLTSQDAPFFLTFVPDSRKILTGAYVLYYDEEWIVNSFSTENSLSRLVEKDLAYLRGPIPDVVDQARQPDDSDIVEIDEDALNLHSDDDTQLFLPMFWSDI